MLHLSKTVGYTYIIKFKLTNQYYYGSRCAKNCQPNEFWVTYFTSSHLVNNLVREYGKESFDYEIRRIFEDHPEKAQDWERKILRRLKVGQRSDFLNKSDGVAPKLFGWKNPFFGKRHSLETRAIMSQKAKARLRNPENNNMYGRKHTEESKRKISKKQKGRPPTFKGKHHSEKTKQKISEAKKGKFVGDNNPSRKPEVRKKLSKRAKENIKNGTNPFSGHYAECEYCEEYNTLAVIRRWHGENCKHK